MGHKALPATLFLLALLAPHLTDVAAVATEAKTKLYIMYTGERQHHDPELVTASHHDMLTSLLGSKKKALVSIVYCYRHDFSGFATTLTQDQAKVIPESSMESLAEHTNYKQLKVGISCSAAAVVEVIDDEIHDGVDVLSMSIRRDGDPHAIHAVSEGIVVVYTGGNEGPAPQTVDNSTLWVITVAAFSIDRSFTTDITLGNSPKLVGHYFYKTTAKEGIKFKSITWASGCDADTLNDTNVAGVVVLCYDQANNPEITPRGDYGGVVSRVFNAGAEGLIYTQYPTDILDFF